MPTIIDHPTYAWHPEGLHIYTRNPAIADPIILLLTADQMMVLAQSANLAASRRMGRDATRIRELERQVEGLQAEMEATRLKAQSA
jgi:hypothetical protein